MRHRYFFVCFYIQYDDEFGTSISKLAVNLNTAFADKETEKLE